MVIKIEILNGKEFIVINNVFFAFPNALGIDCFFDAVSRKMQCKNLAHELNKIREHVFIDGSTLEKEIFSIVEEHANFSLEICEKLADTHFTNRNF